MVPTTRNYRLVQVLYKTELKETVIFAFAEMAPKLEAEVTQAGDRL